MSERLADSSSQSMDFFGILEDWRKNPEIDGRTGELENSFYRRQSEGIVTVMISKEAIKSFNRDEAFLQTSVVEAYGQDRGESISFDQKGGLRFRIGRLKGTRVLFLDKGGQSLAYLHPKFINYFSILTPPPVEE